MALHPTPATVSKHPRKPDRPFPSAGPHRSPPPLPGAVVTRVERRGFLCVRASAQKLASAIATHECASVEETECTP